MKKKLLIASIRNCTSKPKHLSFEVCDSVEPLKVQQQRGWSYAAAVPSEAPDAQKDQKRVSRHKRRAMVESFVDKYREENAGKFPKASDTQKQVGGGYYFIRQIIQELEYKSKLNSSNIDEKLVEKKFYDIKLLTTESMNVSSVKIELAKDRSIQGDSKSVVLDSKVTVNTDYEHLGEKSGSQTSYRENKLSEEVEFTSTLSNQCIASESESNLVEKHAKEPYPSSVDMSNDIKSEVAVAPESQLLQEEREHFPPAYSENFGTGYVKAQGHEYDSLNIENHQKMEEKCMEKAGYERREQPNLEDLSREASQSSLQVENDVRSGETVSSSDSVTQEQHLQKTEIKQFSTSFIEKSERSCSEGESHDSKLVDTENHPAMEKKRFEKAGYLRKDQGNLEDLPGVDGPKHEIEQSQKSIKLDESKLDSCNNREPGAATYSEKSTLWGNLKSFANGIINIWRKL